MTVSTAVYRARTERLAPYLVNDLTVWGETGAQHYRLLDPQTYYIRLAVHMAQGGEIKPLEIGYSAWLNGGPEKWVYVFNGTHRLLIARALGIQVLPVINSTCADAIPLDEDELRGLH